ncbi:hypothetical protein [Clostridium omnivorum]|uniref:Uncharacterized protein n=1 Tax=Clostridium omnivorum TaxID=1604902 RepID=A0ABQ5NCM5_9CLOT|nr:hypothetical protein [Clostridium sp. E14]GLC32930.1 hypothetical protein bsdE14_43400 [Clostridium sp. E14]
MITKRDKEIIKFVETYGSITPKICSKVFFKGNKEAYDQARKRLRVIYREELLKRYRKDPKSEAIYYLDKKLKIHDLKLLDVYTELLDFEILKFEKEKILDISENKKYIIDAAMVIREDEISIPLLIEIDYTHYTSMEKARDIIYFLEDKHKRAYDFIIVKLTQEEIEVRRIGDYSNLFILPWNLNLFSQVTASLGSSIDILKTKKNQ